MKKIKLFIYYSITDEPWGGGNSFLKAFRNYILNNKSNEIEIINNISADYDIFFMNGGHKSQGQYIDINEILKAKNGNFIQKLFGYKERKVLYRLDGARYKYNKTISLMDKLQYRALQNSDFVIFQSAECLNSFREMGYDKSNYTIIHNGVNQEVFNTEGKEFWGGKGKIKLFSCNWSPNINKGYEIISLFSQNPGVESYFVGNWNQDVDSGNVHILPPMKQSALVDHYRSCDVFLHAAENDPCPNVVLEAMSCGLPIIYHDSGGTKEIAAKYGLKLPKILNAQTIQDTVDNIKTNYEGLVNLLLEDKELFSINAIAERYIEVFEKVLN